jgi:HD-GYP domain-containing protein (c-di-GMP phosphodiesterase class II)
MKTQNTNSIYMILGTLAVGIIFSLLYGILIGGIIALVVGGILYLYNKSQSSEDNTEKEDNTKSTAKSSEDALIDLNIMVRSESLPDSIVAKVEKLIDLLIKVILSLEEKYPESQLRFTIDRMPTEYLPKLLNPYIKLEEEARVNSETKVLETLDAMHEEVQEVQNMIDSHKQKDFDQKAAFMAHRFSENY